WQQLLKIRDTVLVAIEERRQAKQIGKSLEAEVRLAIHPNELSLVERYKNSLEELFNVSRVVLTTTDSATRVVPHDGIKCERCWRYYEKEKVQPFAHWPRVCGR